MPAPTETEVQTDLKNAVSILDKFLANQTVFADVDTFLAALKTDFRESATNGAGLVEAQANAVIEAGRTLLEPILASYCHHILNVPERQTPATLDRLYTYFIDNARHVLSRAPTFGTPTAGGSNTGTGVVRRLTVDENDYALENQYADAKKARCVADARSGAFKHEEQFEFRGANGTRGALGLKSASGVGSGLAVRKGDVMRSVSARDSTFRNASFANYSCAGAPATGVPYTLVNGDEITDWAADDVTKLQLDVDTIYRDTPGVVTPVSLVLLGNVVLTQTFEDADIQVDLNAPYYRMLVYRRRSSCDGTLSYRVGSKTLSVDLTTAVNDTWTPLVPSLDKDLWPFRFNENDAYGRITLASRNTGNVMIAEVLFFPMFPFDGSWYAIIGGATKFKIDDSFSWTDSIAADSKIQKWLWILFGRYLPHVANATQVTASGGRTMTFANVGAADTITASSGSFVSDGYKVGMKLTVAGSSSNNGTYTIAVVTATVITVSATDALTNEGPLSATATLNATPAITDPS